MVSTPSSSKAASPRISKQSPRIYGRNFSVDEEEETLVTVIPPPISSADSEVEVAIDSDSEDDILCIICKAGIEVPGNRIVLCDGCDRAYHQICHRPMISQATVNDKDAKWYCKSCTFKR